MSTQVNRRHFVKTIVGSALALSIAPQAFAQYGPIPGKILLRYNENPYGPSAKGLKAGAEAAAVGAYYPDSIIFDLHPGLRNHQGQGNQSRDADIYHYRSRRPGSSPARLQRWRD